MNSVIEKCFTAKEQQVKHWCKRHEKYCCNITSLSDKVSVVSGSS